MHLRKAVEDNLPVLDEQVISGVNQYMDVLGFPVTDKWEIVEPEGDIENILCSIEGNNFHGPTEGYHEGHAKWFAYTGQYKLNPYVLMGKVPVLENVMEKRDPVIKLLLLVISLRPTSEKNNKNP